MKNDTRDALLCVAIGIAIGWWLGSSPESPVNPNSQRPVLSAVGRLARTAARLGLWLAVSAEPPPQQQRQLVHSQAYDAEGHPVLDHREGW
jgi:hypothetical protein